ncbi:glycosyl hydrolase family 16 [Kordia periserrulae]|uniref:Glycosyl hydrolase family 16 n=1 Tax=Kordia periserrulae TaxID=701523 RepID=A0A2T6BZR2_9FLAO|nr:glycoside hydrolase family 16 protein [Kordia periserrulae]PTX61548.1 glycosyl hydrolase family 16 [Kordia periserrulae]
MKKLIKHTILALTLISSIAFVSCEADETQTVVTKTNLIMADEFDVDGAPDPSLWTYDVGDGSQEGLPGWGNNELQVYTSNAENVEVQNGLLVITARENGSGGYTSARIKTEGLFEQQYGRFEARIRLPQGKGLWPAFWLLGNNCDQNPWPACGEIDIMENVGDEPTIVFGSAHGPNFSGAESITKKYELASSRFDTEFHVFGIEWSPTIINYYVDDVLYQSITPETIAQDTNGEGTWVFDNPFYIIINVAVGGNLPGNPDANTTFPQRMLVDYVRVYN